jgi:hypothetical protein
LKLKKPDQCGAFIAHRWRLGAFVGRRCHAP